MKELASLNPLAVFINALENGADFVHVALSFEAAFQPLALFGLLLGLQDRKIVALFVGHDILNNTVSH